MPVYLPQKLDSTGNTFRVNQDQMNEMLSQCRDAEEQFLLAILYLSGRRPTELRQLKRSHVTFEKGFTRITFYTLKLTHKRWQAKCRKCGYKWFPQKGHAKTIQKLQDNLNKGYDCFTITCPNAPIEGQEPHKEVWDVEQIIKENKKHKPYHKVDFKADTPFLNYINDYVKNIKYPETYLVNFKVRKMERIIDRLSNGTLTPYHFRRSRINQMVDEGVKPIIIKRFHNRASMASLDEYIEENKPVGQEIDLQ